MTTRQRIHQYIHHHPNASVNEIAKSLGVTRACVSPQVTNLFKEDLVSRSGNHNEYRYTSTGPIAEPASAPVLHMSEGMALFNKLLRGVRCERSNT